MKSALKKVSLILAICFVAFHLYTAAFGTMPGIAQKSIHLGFLLVIFYINAMVDSERRWGQIFPGIVYASDILFAILLIIAIFEACRRKMGNPLVIITLVFVAYAFLGKYIPGFLNQPGMTLKKFTSLVYLTTDGIFGSPLYASASYVVLFVLLGAIMSVSGIGDYMTNLATSLFGHMRGGPAKVAVVASGFFGSISGSPTANVIGTGTFTIPMMKKKGFEPGFGPRPHRRSHHAPHHGLHRLYYGGNAGHSLYRRGKGRPDPCYSLLSGRPLWRRYLCRQAWVEGDPPLPTAQGT